VIIINGKRGSIRWELGEGKKGVSSGGRSQEEDSSQEERERGGE
jgi:hypothetical protein